MNIFQDATTTRLSAQLDEIRQRRRASDAKNRETDKLFESVRPPPMAGGPATPAEIPLSTMGGRRR